MMSSGEIDATDSDGVVIKRRVADTVIGRQENESPMQYRMPRVVSVHVAWAQVLQELSWKLTNVSHP